ncbi:MAG: transcription elongation factor GreB [Proteobacteria bacterium]|nr:transcription elongation factor GreB [Pseudomonadota bacterium]MCP4919736.1 transcription elongation factor GreB [Pseudomonadota bacterium]
MPSYITPQGFKAIVDEYEHLMKVERPHMTREVAWAASLGDRSENAEYQYGKKRLRQIDGRLHYLKKRLESIEVVDPTEMTGDIVRFSATVTYEDDKGEETTVQIVGEDELDIKNRKISYKSPIGRALVGKEVDDEVKITTPGGVRTVVITEVQWL